MTDYKNIAPVADFDWEAFENGGKTTSDSREAQEQGKKCKKRLHHSLSSPLSISPKASSKVRSVSRSSFERTKRILALPPVVHQ